MRTLLLIFCFLCLSSWGVAQNCETLLRTAVEKAREPDFEAAETYAQKALVQGKKEYAPKSQSYIVMLNTLIAIYNTTENLGKSETFGRERVQIAKELYGTQSEAYISFVSQLGHTYKAEKKYQEAANSLEEARRVANAFYAQKYPDYIQFVNELILLYNEMGEREKATTYCQEATEICQKYSACKNGQDGSVLAYNCASIPERGTIVPNGNYLEKWRNFHTNLLVQGSAPASQDSLVSYSPQIEVITYPSNGRKLSAYLYKGANTSKPKPAMVVLHGGNSAYSSLIRSCKVFTDAGFAVLVPAFRGENGNPGNFEMVLGEVEDAKAAIKWLSEQPFIDKNQVYAFGHSYGGCIAIALSLHPDVPIRFSGSCSGIFDLSTFEQLSHRDSKEVPFDFQLQAECEIRCPVYFLDQMQRSHYLYMGTDDGFIENSDFVNGLFPSKTTKMLIKEVKGDHFSSLEPSINAFFEDIIRLNPSLKAGEMPASPLPSPAEPKIAWLKDFSKAPNIALTNEAYFKGRDRLTGASAFLISYKGKEYGITAKHLIEESGGGYKPAMKLAELNEICPLWYMSPRTLSKKIAKMDKLLNTNDDIKDDILIFSLAADRDESLYPLPVRTSATMPETVWLIGCPYSEEGCQQNKYRATVVGNQGGFLIAENLQPAVELQGFSGAPVIDENGEVLGILTGGSEDGKMIFIQPLKGALERVIK